MTTKTPIDPEAMYDRLAGLTDEMEDDQRRELAVLLLSGDVDAELLALVLSDQATVESDAPATVKDSLTVAEQQVLEQVRDDLAAPAPQSDALPLADLAINLDWAPPLPAIEPLAPEAIETVESAPKYRDDTRLLQCCGVARLIGHRAGCAEAS